MDIADPTPVGSRLIRGGRHNAPTRACTHQHRLPAQIRVVELLHRRKKRVHVEVDDCTHVLFCDPTATSLDRQRDRTYRPTLWRNRATRTPMRVGLGILRRIDDWIFHVEMGNPLDVSRRVSGHGVSRRHCTGASPRRTARSPSSRLAFSVSRAPRRWKGSRRWVPIVSAIIGVGLVYFAFWTAEERAAEPGKQSRIKPVIDHRRRQRRPSAYWDGS